MSAPIVFFDIAGPDAAKLKSFYAENFGWSIDAASLASLEEGQAFLGSLALAKKS